MQMELVRKLRKASYAALSEKNEAGFKEVLDYTGANIQKPLSNDFIEAQKAELARIKSKQTQQQKLFAWVSAILLCFLIIPLSSLMTGIPHKEFTNDPVFLETIIISSLLLLVSFSGCLLAYTLADPSSPVKVCELFQPIEKERYLNLKSLSDELNDSDHNHLAQFMTTLKNEYERDMVLAEFLAWSYHVSKIEQQELSSEIAHVYDEMYQNTAT